MINNIIKHRNYTCLFGILIAGLGSCKKDTVLDAAYPAQTVGISQAAIATVGPGANGIFTITPRVEGQVYRFVADVPGNKINLQMGVLKSGVDFSGAATVNVAANTDTVTKLIASGRLAAGTELLPATAYTLPSALTIEDGSSAASFEVPVKLDVLTGNLTKKYAFAFTISAAKTGLVNPKLATAVIYLDPNMVLLPIANFSNSVDNLSKTISFINVSSNAISYSWNFGDGSPVESKVSTSHKYTASGTYSVTLTANGINGTPVSTKTVSITIP